MLKAKILAVALLSLGAVGIAQAVPSSVCGNGKHTGNPHCTDTSGPSSGGSTTSAPEIDPASASTALTLLMGGLAVLRGRRRTQG